MSKLRLTKRVIVVGATVAAVVGGGSAAALATTTGTYDVASSGEYDTAECDIAFVENGNNTEIGLPTFADADSDYAAINNVSLANTSSLANVPAGTAVEVDWTCKRWAGTDSDTAIYDPSLQVQALPNGTSAASMTAQARARQSRPTAIAGMPAEPGRPAADH